MAEDLIRYDLLVQDALKGVVRKVMTRAQREGLPGEHHFYISFKTGAAGVRLSGRMREKYPDEMTIVLQHQFWDLGVTEHAFEVGLSFGGVPERLLIPFDAVTGFFDPSVEFGLKFEAQSAPPGAFPAEASAPAKPVALPAPSAPTPASVAGAPPAPTPLPSKRAPKGAATEPPLTEPTTPAPQGRRGSKAKPPEPPATPAPDPAAAIGDTPKVVSLDAFRKKP